MRSVLNVNLNPTVDVVFDEKSTRDRTRTVSRSTVGFRLMFTSTSTFREGDHA
jgi:hypothetical protein